MRKLYFFAIAAFLVIGGMIVYFDEKSITEVHILSFRSNYARWMTREGELFSIPIYVSSKESFLTDSETISTSSLCDGQNQMEVDIDSIVFEEESTYFQGNTYYLCMVNIAFDFIQLDQISFTNSYLELIYKNEDTLSIQLGNIDLYFGEINNFEHIDMTRLYATVHNNSGQQYITGIVLGIENRSSFDIFLTSIQCLNPQLYFDLEHAIILNEELSYDTNINELLGYDYPILLEKEHSSNFELSSNSLLFIPIQYKESIVSINRFPLILNYQYLNHSYTYTIDDFLFFSNNYNLEDHYGQIQEYIYQYS